MLLVAFFFWLVAWLYYFSHCLFPICSYWFEVVIWKNALGWMFLPIPLDIIPSGLFGKNLGNSPIRCFVRDTLGLCLQTFRVLKTPLCKRGHQLFIYCHPLGFTGVSIKSPYWVRGLWSRLYSGDLRFCLFGLSFWGKPQVLFCFKQRNFRICGEAEENPASCKKEENVLWGIFKETEAAKIWDSSSGGFQPSVLKFWNLCLSVCLSLSLSLTHTHTHTHTHCDETS